MQVFSIAVALAIAVAALGAQDPTPPPVDPIHKPFDEILDTYVRDGLVYYNALRIGGRSRPLRRLSLGRSAAEATAGSATVNWRMDQCL